jgi:amino acid adenylation domain-containing protein
MPSMENNDELKEFYSSIKPSIKLAKPRKTIIDYFNDQVKDYPEKIAISDSVKELNYLELDRESDFLANYLMQYNFNKEVIIAVYLDRSIEYVISILAILKIGAAFLPISLKLPEERINYILKDADVQILITKKHLPRLKTSIKQLFFDEINYTDTIKYQYPKTETDQLMYVIYTSGSTGKPKGVLLEQAGIISLVKCSEKIKYLRKHNVLQTVDFSFDGSIMEIFGAILNGATLFISDDTIIYDENELSSFIKEKKINHIMFITPLFEKYISSEFDMFKDVETIMFGGEKANYELITQFRKKYPTIKLINCYGPTENSVVTTALDYNDFDFDCIGKALENNEVFCINSSGRIIGENVWGELCISSSGLARGYLNREELTKSVFINHPFDSSKQMYKSGDYAKINSKGYIEFKGRIDNQIKVNGYRIELDEITNAMLSISSIKNALAMFIDKKIIGFVSSSIEKFSLLREDLSRLLPVYMLPVQFINIKEFPLASNAKIDLQQLRKIYLESSAQNETIIQPVNDIERNILTVWQKILKKEHISTDVDFFVAGGSSLDLINVNSKLQTEYPGLVVATDLFSHTSIKSLSLFLQNKLEKENKNDLQYEEF